MPAGSKPGERRGGRKKGTPNKETRTLQEKLDSLGCDPIEGMALIASGKVPCGVCHGEGKTRYKVPGTNKVGERLCESCYGTLLEHISPDLRGRMYAEIAQYLLPKRKALEVTGADGGPLQVTLAEVIRARRQLRKVPHDPAP